MAPKVDPQVQKAVNMVPTPCLSHGARVLRVLPPHFPYKVLPMTAHRLQMEWTPAQHGKLVATREENLGFRTSANEE